MIDVVLELEKETKRTIRYVEPGDDPRVGTIYVPKSTLAELGNPKILKLTLESAS
jgi:hypothetical protein